MKPSRAPSPGETPVEELRQRATLRAGRAWGGLKAFLSSDLFVLPFFGTLTVMAGLLLLCGLQLYAFMHPSHSTYVTTPAAQGLTFEDVRLDSADGTPLAAWFLPSSVGGRRAILVLHGYGSSKAEMLPRVGFLALDYNLLFLDFRDSGESGGTYATFGLREHDDAMAALAWLRGRGYDVVGIYGFSLGASVGLRVMAADAGIRCAVAEMPYAHARTIISEGYAGFGPFRGFMTGLTMRLAARLGHDLSEQPLLADLRSLRRSVLVIASTNDPVIPAEHLFLVKSGLEYDPEVQYLEHGGAAHGELAPGFMERLTSFYGDCLAGS